MSINPINVSGKDLGTVQWDLPQKAQERLASISENERAALLKRAETLVRHSVVLVAIALSAPDPKEDMGKLASVLNNAVNEMSGFADQG